MKVDIPSVFAALRRKPPVTRSDYERGCRALDGGRHTEALAAFDAALACAPASQQRAAMQNKRGVALIALRRRDEALAAFCAALEADEHSASALANLGNLLLEDGDLLDAVDYYEAAIRADDRYHVAHRNLGVACKRLGRHGAAVRALRAAARCEARRRGKPA